MLLTWSYMFFFLNDTATTEIYTLPLHDALPICDLPGLCQAGVYPEEALTPKSIAASRLARKGKAQWSERRWNTRCYRDPGYDRGGISKSDWRTCRRIAEEA